MALVVIRVSAFMHDVRLEHLLPETLDPEIRTAYCLKSYREEVKTFPKSVSQPCYLWY